MVDAQTPLGSTEHTHPRSTEEHGKPSCPSTHRIGSTMESTGRGSPKRIEDRGELSQERRAAESSRNGLERVRAAHRVANHEQAVKISAVRFARNRGTRGRTSLRSWGSASRRLWSDMDAVDGTTWRRSKPKAMPGPAGLTPSQHESRPHRKSKLTVLRRAGEAAFGAHRSVPESVKSTETVAISSFGVGSDNQHPADQPEPMPSSPRSQRFSNPIAAAAPAPDLSP